MSLVRVRTPSHTRFAPVPLLRRARASPSDGFLVSSTAIPVAHSQVGIAQQARARLSHSRGHGFDSRYLLFHDSLIRAASSIGGAPGSQAGGRRFEPDAVHSQRKQLVRVAQLVQSAILPRSRPRVQIPPRTSLTFTITGCYFKGRMLGLHPGDAGSSPARSITGT